MKNFKTTFNLNFQHKKIKCSTLKQNFIISLQVYSIVQKSSFRVAEEILNYLWRENITKDKAVIVVGNKADLARSRVITTAGKIFFKYL